MAVKAGRVTGSFLCSQALGSARSLPCLILWGSQSANTAPAAAGYKRPLSLHNSCAGCDFLMALGGHFMFNGSLREGQTILSLLCMGLLSEGKGPRTGTAGLATAAVS